MEFLDSCTQVHSCTVADERSVIEPGCYQGPEPAQQRTGYGFFRCGVSKLCPLKEHAYAF